MKKITKKRENLPKDFYNKFIRGQLFDILIRKQNKQNKGTVLCFKTIFYLTKKRNKTIEIFKETGGKLVSTVLELTGFRVNMIFRV